MNEPNSRDEAIFDGALQLPPGQRANYIKAACGDDAELHARVQGLLAAHEHSTGPLEGPTVVARPPALVPSLPPSEQPGDRIGPYKILQPIGHGAYRVVYITDH